MSLVVLSDRGSAVYASTTQSDAHGGKYVGDGGNRVTVTDRCGPTTTGRLPAGIQKPAGWAAPTSTTRCGDSGESVRFATVTVTAFRFCCPEPIDVPTTARLSGADVNDRAAVTLVARASVPKARWLTLKAPPARPLAGRAAASTVITATRANGKRSIRYPVKLRGEKKKATGKRSSQIRFSHGYQVTKATRIAR